MALSRPQTFTWFCLGIMIFTGSAGWGEEPTGPEPTHSDDSTILMPEVIVSATRTKEPVGGVPSAPTIFTRGEIDETPYTGGHETDDLLRYVPGVQPSNLSSRYNHPTAQSVSVRGLGTRRALVLLDGIPLNDGFGGWINWGMIPDTIERIEVVPGGGSNLYGTWAMGGVIHLLSEPVRVGKGFTLEGQAGNLETYTGSLSGRYGTDRMGLTLGYRRYHSDGYITVPPDQRGPIDETDGSDHQLFSGSLSLAVTPRTTVIISGNLFEEDRSFGTPLSRTTRTIGTAAVGVTGENPGGHEWETKLYGQWQTFRNQTSVVTPSPTLRLNEVRNLIQVIPSNDFGGLGQWTVNVRRNHRVVIGADARAILGQSEEETFSADGPTGRNLAQGKQVGWGTFGEWIAEPLDGLTVIPSVRMDWWKNFDGEIAADPGPVVVPPDNVETALNPKLALLYRATDHVSMGASAYTAFRAPTLNELYRGFSFAGFGFLPNPELSPERLQGADATLDVAVLPRRRLSLRATGHYETVNDQILFVSQGPLTTMRQNVGKTKTLGAEVAAELTIWEWVRLNAGYAYADSTLSDFPPNPALEGNLVPNVSPHQVVAGVTVMAFAQLSLTVLGRYLSRQFADLENTQPIADMVILDASLRASLGKHWRVFLNAENLTDRQYIATQTGPIKTLGVPRLVMGGVRLEY